MKELTPQLKLRRYLARSQGVRSAFDLSGFGILRENLPFLPMRQSTDPESAIAHDMRRVMEQFGRSATCGRRALDDGIDVEHVTTGCTEYRIPREARKLPIRSSEQMTGMASGTAGR